MNAEALVKALQEKPDMRLKELGERFRVHESTISYALKRLKISRKKNVALRGKQKLSKN